MGAGVVDAARRGRNLVAAVRRLRLVGLRLRLRRSRAAGPGGWWRGWTGPESAGRDSIRFRLNGAAIQTNAWPILDTEILRPRPRANVKDFVNHIDYAVKLIGIDHVGISSDFDGGGGD